MQKGKQALLLHLGVCLCLCSTILLPCRNLLLLTTLPCTPSSLDLLFFFSFLPLFIYSPYICSLSRFPILCEEHPSPTPVFHLFIYFLLPLLTTLPPHTLVNFARLSAFLSPSRHAPLLMWELRYYACGVVALAWGSILRRRGVLVLLPPRTSGTGQCAGLER